jgi:hypothetical protein
MHLMDNAIAAGDINKARKLEEIRRLRDPDNSAGLYQTAFRLLGLGDSAGLAAQRAAMDTMSADRLYAIPFTSGVAPGAVADAVRAMELLVSKSATEGERAVRLYQAGMVYSNSGMPGRAARALEGQLRIADEADEIIAIRTLQLMISLYTYGDDALARAAVADIDRLQSDATLLRRIRADCARTQWELYQGDRSRYAAATVALARVPQDSTAARIEANVCAQVLATIDAMLNQPHVLANRVGSLEAVMRTGPAMNAMFRNAANIVLARAAERAGDSRLAERAMSRMAVHPNAFWLRATMWRETGRLAAINGDTARAIRMYTKYLDAHEMAEPALKKEDDAVRAELARLTGEQRR